MSSSSAIVSPTLSLSLTTRSSPTPSTTRQGRPSRRDHSAKRHEGLEEEGGQEEDSSLSQSGSRSSPSAPASSSTSSSNFGPKGPAQKSKFVRKSASQPPAKSSTDQVGKDFIRLPLSGCAVSDDCSTGTLKGPTTTASCSGQVPPVTNTAIHDMTLDDDDDDLKEAGVYENDTDWTMAFPRLSSEVASSGAVDSDGTVAVDDQFLA